MIYEVPGGGFVRSWIISADEGLGGNWGQNQ